MEPARIAARVVAVISGDTIEVEVGGQREVLAYLGIVAPAIDEPMGIEARAANEALVGRRTVYLESDIQDRDLSQRLLRYVFLADGTFVNLRLVSLGYAEARVCLPAEKYWQLMRQREEEAIEAEKGLWSPEASYSRGAPCLDLEVSAKSLELFQPLTVTLTVFTPRRVCSRWGNFLFRLDAQPDLFWDWVPLEPVGQISDHGISTGGRERLSLRLKPVAPGRAVLVGSVQYEGHNILNFAGGWGGCGGEPVEVEVTGPAGLEAPPQATEPTLRNVCRGNILFISEENQQPEMWMMDPTGKRRLRVAYGPPYEAALWQQYRALREAETLAPGGGWGVYVGKAGEGV